jgi:two-component system response regulator FixJ
MTEGKDIVFVVDGDSAVRDSLKFSLELEGLVVIACASGAELMRHTDLPAARCLVLDAQIPLTDVFEIVEFLSDSMPGLPVILLTSRATTALRVRAEAAGVRHVLEKPLLDNSLLARILDVLSDKRQEMPLPG